MERLKTTLIALSALLAVALVGCADDEPETAVEAFEDGGEARVELVTGEPFEGTARVDDVHGPRGFDLLDTLVITTEDVDVTEGDLVRVTGEVEAADEVPDDVRAGLDESTAAALDDEELLVIASDVDVVRDDVDE